MQQIKVYKASAGSGKTEALSQEYIKMLLHTELSDKEKFRRVLAVTFTNKATAEMKARIVEKLYNISKQEKPQDVAGVVVSPDKAKSLLSAILHNYSYFRVSTIDKFFQLIIRAFVQELGLSSNYMVELDEGQVIRDTITDILLKIGDKEYAIFFEWFYKNLTSAEESGEDVKLKTLRKNLENFSYQIFNAKYTDIKGSLPDSGTYSSEISRLKKRRGEILATLMSLAKRFKNEMNKEQFDEKDCSRGSFSPINNFISDGKYPTINDTIKKWANEGAKYPKASSKGDLIEDAYNRWIHKLISEFVETTEKYREEFNTCSLIVKNAPYFLLFNELEREIRKHTQSENTQLLSSSSEFINKIIDGSDTPFIYEKTGTFIDNYLIDEFQDTSRLQWNNFKPLIADSYDSGMENLIVGDVKQSIYRFRDSDWSILDHDIDENFNTSPKVLNHNYRSLGNIIEYNNALFKRLSDFLQTTYNAFSNRNDHTITDAYSDVCQSLPTPRKGTNDIDVSGLGYVSINLIPYCTKDEYTEDVFQKVLDDIRELQSKGYKLSDIGLIYRWKGGAIEIAKFLIKNGINVISEEALLVSSNSAVNDMTAVLTYIVNRNDKASGHIVENFLPPEIKESISQLSKLPLYELIEQIIYLCGMDKDESNIPYLNAFRDLVADYIDKKGSNIKEFLEWWSDVKENKSLTTSSTADAVNIITLHKSKGLAFKAVIIPEMNWDFKANKQAVDILWEKIPASAPEYSLLKCVPIEFNATMRDSIFKDGYYDEVLMQYIDNLNLLYVAFTRAKYVLIGYSSQTKYGHDYNKVISSIFPIFNGDVEFHIGEIPNPADFDKGKKELMECEDRENNNFQFSIVNCQLSPSEKMALFPLRDADGITEQTERGSRMHRIMEKVVTESDIEPQIDEMLLKGHIDNVQYDTLLADLTEYVRRAPVEWFDGSMRVVTERTIINIFKDKDGRTVKREKRPDRVLINTNNDAVTVIDYKFGEQKEKSHISQVRDYMNLYKETGHKNVTGYIYYFENFEIVKVD